MRINSCIQYYLDLTKYLMEKDKMASCCVCPKDASAGPTNKTNATTTSDEIKTSVPLICLVPCGDTNPDKPGKLGTDKPHKTDSLKIRDDVQFIDINRLKKHFKFPSRPLYLDPFRRPLITFPMTQEGRGINFTVDRKAKINQQILDGFLDSSEAIFAPSIFPHSSKVSKKKKDTDEDEEIVYILQLPDLESKCPEHNEVIKTPRPLDRSGSDVLSKNTPVIVQINSQGKWEGTKPSNLDEDRLKNVVQRLVDSNALPAAHGFCQKCGNKTEIGSGKSQQFVPIIVMPIFSAGECPLDPQCEKELIKDSEVKPKMENVENGKGEPNNGVTEKARKKSKKRGFVLQRLTDFDLMSQW